MAEKMSRRAFIRKSAAIGATSLVGKGLISTSSYGAPESFPNAAAWRRAAGSPAAYSVPVSRSM